ncbi:hypothetical protein H0X48_01315 [Candidatus Dependentiae bacterium]|nr:hypothetical protein [Candidatus Dependentiae bacterium]
MKHKELTSRLQAKLLNFPIASLDTQEVAPITRQPFILTGNQQINPFYTLDDFIKDTVNVPANFSTGYASLDSIWKIPTQSLTIIAGRPSHGKTTLLLNLFLNLIQHNAQATFLFCSYEVTRKQLLLNILNSICKVELDAHFNNELLTAYLMGTSMAWQTKSLVTEQLQKIEQGKKNLTRLVNDNRLALVDEHLYVEDLVCFLANFKDRYPLEAVFIDYIQKIKIKGRFASRQLELQKISEYLLEAALKLSLPIVLGAQFNREVTSKRDMEENKLREAGDIEQDAHSIIGIWNESKANAHFTGQPTLELVVLKNRNGKTGGEVSLRFKGSTFSLEEHIDQCTPAKAFIERKFY